MAIVHAAATGKIGGHIFFKLNPANVQPQCLRGALVTQKTKHAACPGRFPGIQQHSTEGTADSFGSFTLLQFELKLHVVNEQQAGSKRQQDHADQ